jgi:nickel/cobalt transporter (NicO) family protein
VRSRARSVALLGACGALLAGIWAAPAQAHPLGNLSTNHLSQVRISDGRIEVRYILDQAEIPTFQEQRRADRDGDGKVTGAERARLLERKVAEIAPALYLRADGRSVALGAPRQARLTFPPGQSGLSLTRVVGTFEARLADGAGRVELRDGTYPGKPGWKAIQVLPGEGTDVRSSVAASDPTAGLRRYPKDLLESPPDERRASFRVSAGSGRVTAPDGRRGGDAAGDRALDGFAGALTSGDAHGFLVLFLLAGALGWGALHALSPGHGKAMVAGYLVGARGTPRHALILGLTVTATHTVSVFALGLVTLFASQYVLPEQLYPWLAIASGLMVVAIGLWVMRSRYRRWRALRAQAEGEGGDHHHHGHDHGHHHHHHPEGPITMRGLLALGVSGGIVPCPSALVVLIAAISQHRVGLGMALILAFSVGLAATLTAVGLAVLYGGRLIARLRPERRLMGGRLVGALPAVSATVIVLAGTLITLRAIPQLG